MNTTKKAFIQVSGMFSTVVFFALISSGADPVSFVMLGAFFALGVSSFVCALIWAVSFRGIFRAVGRFLRAVASGGIEVKTGAVRLPSNF